MHAITTDRLPRAPFHPLLAAACCLLLAASGLCGLLLATKAVAVWQWQWQWL
jgi:hypothetical protein